MASDEGRVHGKVAVCLKQGAKGWKLRHGVTVAEGKELEMF